MRGKGERRSHSRNVVSRCGHSPPATRETQRRIFAEDSPIDSCAKQASAELKKYLELVQNRLKTQSESCVTSMEDKVKQLSDLVPNIDDMLKNLPARLNDLMNVPHRVEILKLLKQLGGGGADCVGCGYQTASSAASAVGASRFSGEAACLCKLSS